MGLACEPSMRTRPNASDPDTISYPDDDVTDTASPHCLGTGKSGHCKMCKPAMQGSRRGGRAVEV